MNLRRVIEGFLLSVVFLSFFAYIILSMPEAQDKLLAGLSNASQNNRIQNAPGNDAQLVSVVNPWPEISAESAISVESDLNGVNRIIFAKDVDKKLPIASLTKLMTAIVVLDNYKLSDAATVGEIADSQDPMKQDVKLGDAFSVESFLNIMLIGSSNKSAYALAELIGKDKFVDLMNKKARNIGLESTFFADPTGLSPQNISTVNDLVRLAKYILNDYPKIAEISSRKEFYVQDFGTLTNTNQLLGATPGVICSKTGFTIAAKGCLLLVTKNPNGEDYLINVILGADERFFEMEKLINFNK